MVASSKTPLSAAIIGLAPLHHVLLYTTKSIANQLYIYISQPQGRGRKTHIVVCVSGSPTLLPHWWKEVTACTLKPWDFACEHFVKQTHLQLNLSVSFPNSGNQCPRKASNGLTLVSHIPSQWARQWVLRHWERTGVIVHKHEPIRTHKTSIYIYIFMLQAFFSLATLSSGSHLAQILVQTRRMPNQTATHTKLQTIPNLTQTHPHAHTHTHSVCVCSCHPWGPFAGRHGTLGSLSGFLSVCQRMDVETDNSLVTLVFTRQQKQLTFWEKGKNYEMEQDGF